MLISFRHLLLPGAVSLALPALADDLASPRDTAKAAAFDILAARVSRNGDGVTFRMTVAGEAGTESPQRPVRWEGRAFMPMSGR